MIHPSHFWEASTDAHAFNAQLEHFFLKSSDTLEDFLDKPAARLDSARLQSVKTLDVLSCRLQIKRRQTL